MSSIKAAVYTAHAHTTGGRTGTSKTDDGRLAVTLDTPAAMGGNDGPGTNPEQLFAAGYSACFLGALKFVAGKEKVTIPDDAKVTATVGIGPREDGGGFGIEASLEVSVPGVDKAVVEDLVRKAHVVCPYSHATRGNLDVKTTVV